MGNLGYQNNQQSLQSLSGAQCSAPQTGIQSATQRVSHRTSELSKSVIDLREIIDRLVGSDPPENSKGGAPVGVPSGDLQALHAEIDGYEITMAALAFQINRLRAL